MFYALRDRGSIDPVANYDNLRDVSALVLEDIERNGPQDTDTLALEVEVEDEHDNVGIFQVVCRCTAQGRQRKPNNEGLSRSQ